MKLQRNKTFSTIALILMLTVSAIMVSMPAVNAHSPPWTVPTICYAAVSNSIIGVNQPEAIVFWTNAIPPTSIGDFGDRWTFTVEVTKPDGSKDTLGPTTSDPVGGGYFMYTPAKVGTYSVVAKFPGKVITGLPLNPNPTGGQDLSGINDTYSASTSAPVTFIVQQTQIQPWPEAPLPTQFWTRPINSANRNWAQLAGDWLAGAAQIVGPTTNFGYGTGPESAHIMWATPMWAGGLADARLGNIGYTTSHYEGLNFIPPIILNGKIYYNVVSLPVEGWLCVDLYTGKTEYFFNTSGPATGASQSSSGSISQQSLAFGQVLNFECPNQHGAFPYLWSTTGPGGTWMMYDAFTGNYMCSIANVSAGGTAVYGKDGSILRYNIVGTGANMRLTVWNTTQAIWWRGTQQQYQNNDFSAFLSNNYWLWRPGLNVTFDGSHGFSLNASIPAVQGGIFAVREDQYVIGGTSGKNNDTYTLQGNLWALNLKEAADGTITPTLLWNITYTPPKVSYPDAVVVGPARSPITGPVVDPEDGVFVFKEGASIRRWGYSLATGQLLWTGQPEPAMNYYGWSTNIYQGMLLSAGYSGELIAYNITTGKILWNYNATQVGFESPYGNYPIVIDCIADGKIYLVSGEHSATQPLWRGSYLRCINASNGAELWKVLHWGGGQVAGIDVGGASVFIADGFVVGLNYYDNQIYCYGKGPSATTILIQNDVIAKGSSVLIKGTVTDQSPGAKDTPAIADANMEAWMEYLYAQQAKPTNATGVPVTLTALDPNGNTQNIGTATSDMSGAYSIMWTPPVPGKYVVTASFDGSESYWPSSAETAFGVMNAPTAQAAASPLPPSTSSPQPASSPSPAISPTPPTPPSNPASSMTLYIAAAAAVIIVVVAAAALALRRRK